MGIQLAGTTFYSQLSVGGRDSYMFSAYPDGWPGLGLLLLRAATGSVIVVQGIASYQKAQTRGLPILAMIMVMLLIGILLCIGLLTRFATAMTLLGTFGSMFSWFPLPKAGLLETWSTSVLALMIATAVAFLGPGAFSIDARIFGRREVIIRRISRG